MGRSVATGAAVVRSCETTAPPAYRSGVPADEPPSAGCPELDCLYGRLSTHLLNHAALRARAIGIGAEQVLIANGAMDEETYVRALAAHLGTTFEPLDEADRGECPLDDFQIIEAARNGILLFGRCGQTVVVLAPRRLAARRLSSLHAVDPTLARRFHLTTSARLNRFILRHAGTALADHAATNLQRRYPDLSAAPPRRIYSWFAAMLGSVLAIASLAPDAVLIGLQFMLSAVFLAWLALRVGCAMLPRMNDAHVRRTADEALPTYTVIAALYREASSVNGLLSALAKLDYPPEKLDVILAVEADDGPTLAAIAARTARLPVTVIPVPAGGPRTKPRALNAALAFARGHFTVIFDAEDRPEPDQLRRALQAFAEGGERLACVQARLSIDNTEDSWVTRLFTAEYASQFDVFLEGLAALRLPLPLGGSSNHFRTDVLRAVGAWDAYNVTEDADLGVRLARFGYATGTIASSTYEEAPARVAPWLRQRTRWLKGWMQTWAVHMREPLRLWRDLGPDGFLAFQLVVAGNVLAALIHPIFIAGVVLTLVGSSEGNPALWAVLFLACLAAGYLVSVALCLHGLMQRGLISAGTALWRMPVHWMLLSLAAWRALWQFARAPYTWEKTEHGLARSSRLHLRTTRSPTMDASAQHMLPY